MFRKTNVIDSTRKETRYQTQHSGNNLFLKDQFLNIYAHTAKIQGTFRVNHIAKDREGLLSVLSDKIQLLIGVINRMPVKTFHVRWILYLNLTRLPVQQKDCWVFSF